MTVPTAVLALTACAAVLAACDRKESPATAGAAAPSAESAAADASAMAPAPAPHTPGVGEAAYNTPAPMSSPTSPAGAGNPPSDVTGR